LVVSLLESIDNEELKFKVTEIVDKLKTQEESEKLTCETNYLENISSMTG
jgi:hypothetical protein